MDQLKNSLPSTRRALRSTTNSIPEPSTMTPSSSADIAALWVAMAAIYSHKWTSALGADPRTGAGDIWAQGLAGLNRDQIKHGVDSCIAGAYAWPPTLPEFRALCLGVPPFAAVRADADKASPFTILVWQNLDGYRYRQASSDQADRLLREAYELAREHVMRGGELPAMPEAQLTHDAEKKPKVPATREEREAYLEKLRMIYGSVTRPID